MTKTNELPKVGERYRYKEVPEEVSNCCGYAITENTDLCGKCGEHCGVEILEDE